MTRRQSTSSDISSTLSDATTICSSSKVGDIHRDKKNGGADELETIHPVSSDDLGKDGALAGAQQQQQQKKKKRGLRQKAKDVVHDFGAPPTRRQDKKDGKATKNYADVGLMGSLPGGQQPSL